MQKENEDQVSDTATTSSGSDANNMMHMMANLMATIENNRLTSEQRMLQLLNQKGQDRAELFHIMPDLSKGIDNFNGEYEKGGSKEWLEILCSTATLHSWPDEFTLQTAKAHLTGAAKNWYIANMEELTSWEIFKQRFKKTFGVEATLTDKWTKMQSRVQLPGESVSVCFHDKHKLCKKLDLSMEEIKEQVIMGLTNKSIVQGILAKNHADSDELLHDLVSFSRITESFSKDKAKRQNYNNPRRDSQNSVKQEAGVKREPTCFRCGEKGHVKTDCKNEKVRLCFTCNSKDHIAKDCSRKS